MRLTIFFLALMLSANSFAEQLKLQCNVKALTVITLPNKSWTDERKYLINVDVVIEAGGITIDIDNEYPLFLTTVNKPRNSKTESYLDNSNKNTIEVTRKEIVADDKRIDKVKIDRVTGYIYLSKVVPTAVTEASGKCEKIELKNKF